MKIIELMSGVKLPLTNEEADLMARFDDSGIISKRDLDPRDQIIMGNLVKKDVVARRKNEDGKLTFTKKIRD